MDNYTGRVLGNRYILKEIIGVGGMAVVYKATDNIDNKTVAVKILKEEFASDAEFRNRFKNESKTVAVLSHQNIVKVYDVGFGEKIQYIVMEYIEGITLKQYIQNKGRLDWREAVIFTSQILKALNHAHTKGVIHRDIKPQNIMLLKDNRTIKVADFGIARFANINETLNMGDGAIGSVHYISPEQARGELVDSKTDIYSVGVMLYEMLTGQLPFQSESAVSVAIMQLQKEAVMPRKINPAIPVGIEQITMRAMQKSPRDRYQSAGEMLLDIDEFRRNPNARFDYNYFVDTQPTKYVSGMNRNAAYASGAPITARAAQNYQQTTIITQEPDEDDYESEAIAKKNYTVPILFAIIFLFIVVIVGIACYFFTNSEEVTVPEFRGKYIEEIRTDSEYKYFFDHSLIEENLVYTTEYEEGYIFYQSEEAGKKLQISSTSSPIIKLNIAYTSESMTVPKIDKGTKLQEARSTLLKMGFKVETEAVVDTSLDESTVIRLDPPSEKSVAYGSTVTIYYAIPDAGKVAVPSVVGEKYAVAKSDLEALGFTVKVEYRETNGANAGFVIEQSIAPDTTVIAQNTEIIIIVGTTSNKTVAVSVDLPDLTAYGNVYESIYVYVGGSLYKTYSSVKLDGSTHSIEMGGSENTAFKIYVGEQVICSGNVDFTEASPTITNRTNGTYRYEGNLTTAPHTDAPTAAQTTASAERTCTLPSYAGLTYEVYFNQLVNSGFDNIVKIARSSDTVPAGQVISVSADKSTFTEAEAVNAEIRVYVSTGSAE